MISLEECHCVIPVTTFITSRYREHKYIMQSFIIYVDAFYFTCTTVLTVGYGDILLKTQLGKSIAVLLMIIGIGVIGVITTSITLYIANGGRKMQKSYKEKVIEDIKNKLDNYENLTSEDIEDIIKILKALKK